MGGAVSAEVGLGQYSPQGDQNLVESRQQGLHLNGLEKHRLHAV